jgi:DNA polymerase
MPTKHHSAREFIPENPTIPALWKAAQACTACDLYQKATQAVLGAGPAKASVFFIGEQPGDQEDLAGQPFVGPAGQVLDEALAAARIPRAAVYVTNAVKHFKWAKDAKTKRRIHQTPNAAEVRACAPWLHTEIGLIEPEVIVCLGATAAKSLLGRTFSVMKKRGVAVESEWAPAVFATVHPSAVLRAPREERVRAERMFIADMRKVGRYLEKERAAPKRGAKDHRKFSAWPNIAARSDTSSASTRASRR